MNCNTCPTPCEFTLMTLTFNALCLMDLRIHWAWWCVYGKHPLVNRTYLNEYYKKKWLNQNVLIKPNGVPLKMTTCSFVVLSTFLYKGIFQWNILQLVIKNIDSCLNKSCDLFLLNNYEYSKCVQILLDFAFCFEKWSWFQIIPIYANSFML